MTLCVQTTAACFLETEKGFHEPSKTKADFLLFSCTPWILLVRSAWWLFFAREIPGIGYDIPDPCLEVICYVKRWIDIRVRTKRKEGPWLYFTTAFYIGVTALEYTCEEKEMESRAVITRLYHADPTVPLIKKCPAENRTAPSLTVVVNQGQCSFDGFERYLKGDLNNTSVFVLHCSPSNAFRFLFLGVCKIC